MISKEDILVVGSKAAAPCLPEVAVQVPVTKRRSTAFFLGKSMSSDDLSTLPRAHIPYTEQSAWVLVP